MIFKVIKFFVLAVIILVGAFIWLVIDSSSPRHWVGVYPIVDASQQKEASSGFMLPRGDYVIVCSREGFERDDKLIISYEIEIPKERIKVSKEAEVKLNLVQNSLVENIKLNKDMTKGTLHIKILSPSKEKVSVGLVSNNFAGM